LIGVGKRGMKKGGDNGIELTFTAKKNGGTD